MIQQKGTIKWKWWKVIQQKKQVIKEKQQEGASSEINGNIAIKETSSGSDTTKKEQAVKVI